MVEYKHRKAYVYMHHNTQTACHGLAEFFMVYVKNIYPVQFSLDFDTMYNALFVIDFSSDF